MTATIIFSLLLGWLSYWVVKAPSSIISSSSTVLTLREFAAQNWQQFLISIAGVVLVILSGDTLPEEYGKLNGPIPAFMVGGAIPSIVMNAMALLIKK